MTIEVSKIDSDLAGLFRAVSLPVRPASNTSSIPVPNAEATALVPDCNVTGPEHRIYRPECNYSARELLSIRNALKLGTKLLQNGYESWGPDNCLGKAVHTSEVGILLALAKQNANVITAGFLYDIDLKLLDPKTQKPISETIERKFGPAVLELVLQAQAYITGEQNILQSRDSLSLCCAIAATRSAARYNLPYSLDQQLTTFSAAGVCQILVNQLKVECHLGSQNKPSLPNEDTTTFEICEIRDALRMTAFFFRDAVRKWGLKQTLPLSAHQCEVGLIAILAGCGRDTVIASFLHDLFEGYIKTDRSYLENLVQRKFGQRVLQLVTAVTEPPKQITDNKREPISNWKYRKNAVLENIREGDLEIAELSVCTKISTISAGNKILYEGGKVSDWSQAPAHDNNQLFIEHIEDYAKVGVRQVLIDQFEVELSKFILLQASLR